MESERSRAGSGRSPSHRIGAAGWADVGGAVADLAPLDAADRAKLDGLVFALGTDFVGGQGRILGIFSG